MIFEDSYGHVWPNKRTQNRTHFKETCPVCTESHTTRFFQRRGVLRENYTLNILIYSEISKNYLFVSLLFLRVNPVVNNALNRPKSRVLQINLSIFSQGPLIMTTAATST